MIIRAGKLRCMQRITRMSNLGFNHFVRLPPRKHICSHSRAPLACLEHLTLEKHFHVYTDARARYAQNIRGEGETLFIRRNWVALPSCSEVRELGPD